MPPIFDPVTLLEFIVRFQRDYELHVTHIIGATYTIDLPTCFELLSAIKRPFRLAELFDERWSRASPVDWLAALKDYGEELGIVVSRRASTLLYFTGLII